ncbi:MAG: hypothetical protein LYZ69_00115 [Nitrososphaerales archaeon]|nr:hypothetical protein [Nitrososphaerales archaeon]
MAIARSVLPDTNQLELLDSLAREFREEFEALSENAERVLSGRHFVFNRYGKELYPYFEDSDAAVVPGCIIPIKEGRPVASVDSTCVLIGETSDGALYAARTAVGISREGSLRNFFRLGPILVYASASGLAGMRSELSSPEMSLLLSDHAVAERVIRNTIERRVTESLLSSEEETIVMADGSLRHPFGQFAGSMAPNGLSGNCLVGFSKSSDLILSESAVGSITKMRGAAYHRLGSGLVSTVLAKFTVDGLVFRLDVAATREPVEAVLGRILWNDAFSAGYPESLKAAHHLSVFSKADGEALKAFVTKKFRLKQLPTFTLRTIALGGFRGGA